MNEILVLYILNKSQTTMYGLSKYINKNFGFITKPSFGTLQPILRKLESKKYVFSSKFYTEGGKPYFYYSVNPEGIEYLKEKMMKKMPSNPTQFLSTLRVKLACLDVLNSDDKKKLLHQLKTNLLKLKSECELALKENSSTNFTYRLVLDNSLCEYKNLISLVEGLENACNS